MDNMKSFSHSLWAFCVILILSMAASQVSAELRAVGFTKITLAQTTTTTTLRLAPTLAPVVRTIIAKTTTTTVGSDDYGCEDLKYPSAEQCKMGKCPLQGYDCTYISSAASAGYCKCIKYVTTTTQPKPTFTIRQYTTTTQQGLTYTIRPYTTTTLQYRWCQDVANPSERMCMVGLCPPNTVCRLRSDIVRPSGGTLTQASSGSSGMDYPAESFFDVYAELTIDTEGTGCVCVPCRYRPPTTTLPSRCETVSPASERQCRAGLCPPNTRCVFKPQAQLGYLAAAPMGGTCECVGGTTTTLPPRCEAMDDTGVSQCMHGLCPPDYRCRYVRDLTAASQGYCRCVQPTTTTLPDQTRCEIMSATGDAQCRQGLCPNDHNCRYVPSLAAANMGGCRCIPPTTTTLQGQVRCEAVDDAGAETCKRGLCPPDQKCRYVEGATAANTGSCLCVSPPTTTTIPANTKCERITDASGPTCEQGICPDDYKCEVISYTFGSTQVKNCVCVPKSATTTTTIPGDVKCEAMDYAAQKTCKEGLCPPNTFCEVVKYNFGSTQVANCVCMEKQTTTTIAQTEVKCEAITDVHQKSCMQGLCPSDSTCRIQTDDSGANHCKCLPTTKTTIERQEGFLTGLWRTVFG